MTALLFLVATVLFLMATVAVLQVRGLIAHTMRRPTARLAPEDVVPKNRRRQFAALVPEPEAQGFTFSHYEHRHEVYLNVSKPLFTMVLAHPRTATFAYLSPSQAPDAALPLELDFATFFAERVVYTMQGRAGGVVPGGNVIAADTPDFEVDQHWAAHQKHLDTMTSALGQKMFPKTPEAHVARWNLLTQRYFDWLAATRAIKPFDDGYRLRLGAALKIRKQVSRSHAALQTWRIRKLAAQDVGPDPLLQAAETDAYFRAEDIRSTGKLSGWFKTAIFAASAVFFALLFGVALSPSLLLLLIPVLLFHELGHFLAMWLFGYRDLQVLFMPFGAAVIGEKRDVSAWKEVVVYLAGPVPGLLLALGIVLAVPDLSDRPLLAELALLLAGLNFFNLLPLQPLDGGQLVNRLLAGRLPFLPMLSQLITVSLFLLGWAFIGDSLLGVLALYLSWLLLSQVRSWWHWRKSGIRLDREQPERVNVNRAFAALASVKEPFVNKFQQVQGFVYQLEVPRARVTEIVAGLAVYALVLIGPPAIWLSFGADLFIAEYSGEAWDERVAATNDPATQLALNAEAGEMMWMAAEYEDAKRFLHAAIDLAESHDLITERPYAKALATLATLDQENASDYLERLEASARPDDLVLAEAYFNAAIFSDSDETIGWLTRAIEIYANNNNLFEQTSAIQELASQYAERGDLKKAEAVLLDATGIPADPESKAELMLRLADLYIRSDRLDDARQTLQNNLAPAFDDYTRSAAHRELGWLELYAGQPEKAGKHFVIGDEAVAKMNQELRDDLGWLGRILLFGDDDVETPAIGAHEVVLAHQLGDAVHAERALDAFLAGFAADEYYGVDDFIASTRTQATGCNLQNETEPCLQGFSRQATLLLEAIATLRPELIPRAVEKAESKSSSETDAPDTAENTEISVELTSTIAGELENSGAIESSQVAR